MKTLDLLKTLQASLPQLTDKFTEKEKITAIAKSGTKLTITPNIEDMEVGDCITLSGIRQKNSIASYSASNGLVEITTQFDNQVNVNSQCKVLIYDGTDEVYYDLEDWKDSKTFIIKTNVTDFDDSFLIENEAGYNAQFKITKINANDFEIDTSRSTSLEFHVEKSYIEYAYNIFGVGFASQIDRYIESNTDVDDDGIKVPLTSVKPALWVRMIDEATSQKRETTDDGIATTTRGDDAHLEIIKQFEVVLTYPVNDSVTGFDGACYAEELIILLNRCLFGLTLPNYTQTKSEYVLIPVSNEPLQTDGGIYQHQFVYQGFYEISNTDEGKVCVDADGNEYIEGNDGVNEEGYNLQAFELQYKLKADDFTDVKKTDKFSLENK